jgi:hypothetical protein
MLKANLGLECGNNHCVQLMQRLLHGKHVKGRAALHARTRVLGSVRPVLGTVPSTRVRAIPYKVAKHTTLPTFDRLARQRVESTDDSGKSPKSPKSPIGRDVFVYS